LDEYGWLAPICWKPEGFRNSLLGDLRGYDDLQDNHRYLPDKNWPL